MSTFRSTLYFALLAELPAAMFVGLTTTMWPLALWLGGAIAMLIAESSPERSYRNEG